MLQLLMNQPPEPRLLFHRLRMPFTNDWLTDNGCTNHPFTNKDGSNYVDDVFSNNCYANKGFTDHRCVDDVFSNAQPTTHALTTHAPTTHEPTTRAPTTVSPTTDASTTYSPTTAMPTRDSPTTAASTTYSP
eukprot:844039_1